ncbi:MAG TPA: nuclear transport factor 2 family protein [Pyrinomonadaceae bacterium]|nr:nuclear transport factor 2 family protein [Pyrinomonadaceae bacterium]
MKSILTLAVLFAALSLCNLTDKSKPDANSNAPAPSATREAGVDRVALTIELMRLEQELTTASFNGDISTLANYVADDYSGTGIDGVTQNKNQLLASTKPDKLSKSWKITDGELVSATEDSAVLTYIQSVTLKDGRTFRARVTDTFVKRNGRWVVKSEQATLMK